MREPRNFKLLTILILSLCLTLPCFSQDQRPAVETVRQLPSGNWLLKVDGVEVEGITLEQKRELLKAQIELESLRAEAELLRKQIAEYELITSLFHQLDTQTKAQVAVMTQQIVSLQGAIDAQAKQLELIQQQTRINKVERIISNPVGTLAFKLLVPVAGLFIKH
jgi:hypothetical protein